MGPSNMARAWSSGAGSHRANAYVGDDERNGSGLTAGWAPLYDASRAPVQQPQTPPQIIPFIFYCRDSVTFCFQHGKRRAPLPSDMQQ